MKAASLTVLSLFLLGCSAFGGENALEAAYEACDDGDFMGPLELGSDSQSLVVRGVGEDAPEGDQGDAIFAVFCVLEETAAPSSVSARMETTSAMDGQQEARTNELIYRWSYHPDSGLDFLVELAPD